MDRSNNNERFTPMEVNFADILIEHKVLILPTIGKFTLVPMPATIDSNEGVIHPSFYKIQFEQIERYPSYSREIADYLYLRMGLEKDSAIEYAKEITSFLNEKKEQSAIVPLNGLGRIFTTKAGKVNFMPEDLEILKRESILRPNFLLEKAKDSPLEKTPLVPQTIEPPTTSIPLAEKKKKKLPWWPLLLVLLLPLLWWLLPSEESSGRRYSVSKDASAEDRINVKPLEQDLILKGDSSFQAEQAYSYDIDNRDEEQLLSIDEKNGALPPLNKSMQEKRCTLIVGAFRNPNNIEKIKKQLLPFPGEIVELTMGDLIRVGMIFSCDPIILDVQLTQIRKEIQPNAWILEN